MSRVWCAVMQCLGRAVPAQNYCQEHMETALLENTRQAFYSMQNPDLTDQQFEELEQMSNDKIQKRTTNVDKIRFDLIDAEALLSEAKVMSMGAIKYEERSWEAVVLRGESWRYVASSLRHINAIQRGEIIDPESGEPHASHLACNAHFLAWAALHGYMKEPKS